VQWAVAKCWAAGLAANQHGMMAIANWHLALMTDGWLASKFNACKIETMTIIRGSRN
jgi:hypothetical protein